MKTGIKSIFPKARVVDKTNPNVLRVKGTMSDSAVSTLSCLGWTVEGRIRYSKGGQCVGFTNGTDHVSVEDTGKSPWFLGDTLIRTDNVMTTFHDYPVELR